MARPHKSPPAYAAETPQTAASFYAAPAGPPPGYHDWQAAVPDTALFPPPPAVFDTWERSPANNASEQEAAAGAAWCVQHPLPAQPLDVAADSHVRTAIERHDLGLVAPPGFRGTLQRLRPGVWAGRTTRQARDSCLLAYPPLYAPRLHCPRLTGTAATVYYEVRIGADSRDEVSLALGLATLPYPAFRLPGWHRGSLAVHGDDGHRYVHDDLGGHSFVAPFRRGDTYGLGMRFAPGAAVDVFFTHNGTRVGGWDLHEEVDADRAASLVGLEGGHDLCAAIGTFDAVSFVVCMDPAQWLYRV